MRVLTLLMALLIVTASLLALPTYLGYSGAPGRGTCAASCHGLSGGTVTVSGFPGSYIPNQAYLITVHKLSGLPIKNFNASVRFATGSTNAGLITSGTGTETYDVFGETNGVHMPVIDQDSASFTWTAPAQGFGIVRLYVGAHQGLRDTGPNTTIVIASQEEPIPPGQASGPNPSDGQTGVSPDVSLHWVAGMGATSHDVYYGATNPPPLIAQFFEGTFFDPDPNPEPATTYYWRIDARNDAGVTEGNVWQFTVMGLPSPATDPVPTDSATNVPVDIILEWTGGQDAVSHDVYMGFSPDSLNFAENVTVLHYVPPDTLLHDTTYYWRVDERNPVGVTIGAIWRFTTEAASNTQDRGATVPAQYALGPAYPNPFNATVTIPFALPQASEVRLAVYDILGREVAVLAAGDFPAGVHSVSWTRADGGSGIYFVKLTAPSRTMTMKIVALK